jgi:hypothetical protein
MSIDAGNSESSAVRMIIMIFVISPMVPNASNSVFLLEMIVVGGLVFFIDQLEDYAEHVVSKSINY